MPPEDVSLRKHRFILRAAWVVWAIVFAFILVRIGMFPKKNNCFLDHYQPAGLNWYHGVDLYGVTHDTCRYSPLVHAMLVPFSVLPEWWGSICWRIAIDLMFLTGLILWLRWVCPQSLTGSQRAALLIAAVPLAIGSVNNGQGNVLMMAGILIGIAGVSARRWNLAAVGFALACLVKVYPVALVLLVMVIHRRTFPLRFLLALTAGVLLPFILQDPSYVARQYNRWFANLETDDRSNWILTESYRDVWLLIRVTGLPIDFSTYRLIQIGVGGLIGLLCLHMAWRGDAGRALENRVLGLGCCWMTAFGPAAESPTYILLCTTMSWLLVEAWRGAHPRWTRWSTTLAAVLFFGTVIAVGLPFRRVVLALGPQPIAALCLLATLVALCLKHPVREIGAAARKLPPAPLATREKAA